MIPCQLPENPPSDSLQTATLYDQVLAAIRECYDPEIPVNIYDLGLIYNVDIDSENNVQIKMTLTSPGCPVAGTLPGEVEQKVKTVANVKDAKVELVWDPPWDKDKMTEAAKLQLNLY